MEKDMITEAIALLNTANYDSETLNHKRDEIVNKLKQKLNIYSTNSSFLMYKDWFTFTSQEDGVIGLAECPNCNDTVVYDDGCVKCDTDFEFN